MTQVWTILTVACMLACGGTGAAQQAAPVPVRSTLAGVFSQGQLAEGRALYQLRCRSCHTPADHGATVRNKWSGRPLSEVFQYVAESMPKDSPGTLSPDEGAFVLAYLLQLAGMPPGALDLPPDMDVLGGIRFDTVTTRPAIQGGEVKP